MSPCITYFIAHWVLGLSIDMGNNMHIQVQTITKFPLSVSKNKQKTKKQVKVSN